MHEALAELRGTAAPSPSAIDPAAGFAVVPIPAHKPTDADILSVLCDLFAGRTEEAFGESLDWWAETFQCDIGPRDAAGVVVAALSKWDFDRRAGAKGIAHLQEELVLRARRLIEAGAQS